MAMPERADSAHLNELADPSQFHGRIEITGVPAGALRRMLERMILIRRAEERIGDAWAAGQIRCPCHLAIGQEAAAVGLAEHLGPGDRVFGAHRSHAHYLALGGDLRRLLAEVQGKDTGCSRGMGGSMHLTDVEHGLYGTVPLVGATIPIAVGAGLAAKMEGGTAVAVSCFGDGASEEGVLHESLNLASVKGLPVIFVCENNLFASHLHISLRQPRDSTCRFAEAHAIPWERVEGNDTVAVWRAAQRAIGAARRGEGPQYLEAVTYRWRGHVGPREDLDVGVKRKDDLAMWKRRDPIRRLAEAMVHAGLLTEAEVRQAEDAAKRTVDAAWEQARQDLFPPVRALWDRVYYAQANVET
jgi:pyruvate dehydrogenase E1 component alpha subunit